MSRRRPPPTAAAPFRHWPAIVLTATLLAFLPALRNSLVDWDDLNELVRNAAYRSGPWEALRFAFTTGMGGHYAPLTWLSFSLDYAFWGVDPVGFHLTNVVLHSLNAVLFFYIAKRLLALARPQAEPSARDLGAAFAALFFSLHPLRVESVAWATERKDVLSGFFYLLSFLYYLRERRRRSLVFFFLALLSKISAITLPAALLIVDVYPLRRKPDWLGKWPYLAVAVLPVIGNVVAEAYNSAFPGLGGFGPAARFLTTGYGLVFYPLKTLWPRNLAPLYPFPAVFNAHEPRLILAAVVVILATAALCVNWRRYAAVTAVVLFYVVTLSPMAGFIRSWPQIAADRYSYLPCLGFALLAGAGLSLALERSRELWPAVAAGGLCLGLSALTWAQCGIWKDTRTLWGYELARQPGCAVAHYNLGSFYLNIRQPAQAEQEFRSAIAIDPRYAYAWNNLGNALCAQRRWAESLDAYRRAAAVLPGYWEAENNLGLALESLGRVDEAIQTFKAAIVTHPEKSGPHENLALAYMSQGKSEQAREELTVVAALGRDQARMRQLQNLLRLASNSARRAD